MPEPAKLVKIEVRPVGGGDKGDLAFTYYIKANPSIMYTEVREDVAPADIDATINDIETSEDVVFD